MKEHKILVIESDPQMLKVLRNILTKSGFECGTAGDGVTGMEMAVRESPDLIIIDRMTGLEDGIAIACEIKGKPRLTQIPILMLITSCSEEDKISALESCVDDFVCKPFSTNEFIAKIKAILRHSTRIRDSHPTTNLPGGNALEKEIDRRLRKGDIFALLHVDIDNFKAYADSYGFNKANRMIKLCGEIIGDVVEDLGDSSAFLAHIGGDDFIIIIGTDYYESVANEIIRAFDDQRGVCFNEEDLSRGCFKALDRKGEYRDFPITTLSIGIISNEKGSYRDASEMGSSLVKAKNKAKSRDLQCHQASSYIFLEQP